MFLPDHLQLVLASKSPRRQELLRDMGYDFIIRTKEVNEDYDDSLQGAEIAEFLAEKKALAQGDLLADNEILLTSDTVVWCEDQSLAKASNEEEARAMLKMISGRTHSVITGVCLLSKNHREVFSAITRVSFRVLSDEEIDYYIRHYQPFDKAGAYGIQEWIGMWAIESIQGSYFNVVGLPTHLLPQKLARFT